MRTRKELRQYLFKKKRGLLPNAYKENYKQFIKMLDGAPWAGHNGGNPAAALWFFGMESFAGVGAMARNKKLRACTPGDVSGQGADACGFDTRLGELVTRLGLATDVRDMCDLYSPTAGFYCANLYPFAIDRRHGYEALEQVYKLTGLPTIEEYEEACCARRMRSSDWAEFTAPARVIVCLMRRQCSADTSDHWFNCLCMMSQTWAQFGDLATRYQAAIARGDDVVQITSGDRTFIFAPPPAHRKDIASHMDALAKVIRAAAAEQGVKLPPAQQS